MESTGTYGDAMRYQFRRSGFGLYQISAKRVSDAQEIFDGVPSQHDAKAAILITRLHRNGISKPWVELTDVERNLNALRANLICTKVNIGATRTALKLI